MTEQVHMTLCLLTVVTGIIFFIFVIIDGIFESLEYKASNKHKQEIYHKISRTAKILCDIFCDIALVLSAITILATLTIASKR